MVSPNAGAHGPGAGRQAIAEIANTLIAGALAGGLAGLAEAGMMQLHGFGARSVGTAVVFAAASSEISLPLGAVIGGAVYVVRQIFPRGIWQELDRRAIANWIYGAGIAVPFLAAAYFRLFLWLL